MYMKITTLTIIVVLTAIILVTAGAFNSPALAKPSTSSKDTSGTKSSKDTSGTKSSSGTTSSGTSSTVSKQLKSLISCLTSTSEATGTLPTSSQYKTCKAQSSAGTVGGSTVVGGKTGGGLVPSTSGSVGTSFLGSAGKVKTGSSSNTGP
jgi:cytoskeletal protein RodZ